MNQIRYILTIISITLAINVIGQTPFKVDQNIDYKKIELIETRTESFGNSRNHEIMETEIIDSLGRVKYRTSENLFWIRSKRFYHYYYELQSTLPHKTIYIIKQDSNTEILDTSIIRHSYNSKKLLTNEVCTDYNDSLLWIRNYEYNLNSDVVFRSYHKKKEVKSPFECAQGYTIVKDSIVYDYKGNLYVDHLVSSGGIIQYVSGPIVASKETTFYDEFGNFKENENIKIEYEYDDNGNWILKKRFSKQYEEIKLEQITHRKIRYRN